MSMQEVITFALGAAAAGYLVLRVLRRRRAGTCCGARTCPAAADLLRRLERERERGAPAGRAASPERP